MAKHSPRFERLAEEAKARIHQLGINDLQPRLNAGQSFHLIDVREESEWAKGHLPGAMHLSKGVIERDIERAIPELDAEIILYCGGGYRSALAAENLQRMGYHNVWSMDGGFRAWTEAGYPTEKS